MSGSPIIQNGKFIGAVTHVLVNNPEEGYAVFGDIMLKQMRKVRKIKKSTFELYFLGYSSKELFYFPRSIGPIWVTVPAPKVKIKSSSWTFSFR